MRILFFSSLCLLFVSVLWFLPEAHAAGTSYYVAPNGSGSSCTRQSPCSLNTGLSKAGVGDEVVLRNGTYNSTLFTVRSGTPSQRIIIRAENRRQAIVTHTSMQYVKLNHSYVTIRGIVFDGNNQTNSILLIGNGAVNAIFEDNVVREAYHNTIKCLGSTDVIFRHNVVEAHGTEGMYCGSNDWDAAGPIRWQIYGNTFRGGSDTAIDVKPTMRQADIHHNIFENAAAGSIGCAILSPPWNIKFHDNIIRSTSCGTAVLDELNNDAGLDVRNNVFHNVQAQRAILMYKDLNFGAYDGPGRKSYGTTVISGNTFCGLSNYNICERNNRNLCGPALAASGLSVTNNNGLNWSGGGNINLGGAPQSACDAEVTRIMNEMKNLPGVGSDTTPLLKQFQPPLLSTFR